MIRKCYPYGKKKAFNVTYDDGVLQDVRFVELLNQYGLKGTFNLNSALMENEFEWIHETGCVVKRLSTDVVKALYAGHEVASHTLHHPYMHDLSKEGILWELSQDKRNLEALFGEELALFQIVGHSYDLDMEKMWDRMETIFQTISGQDMAEPEVVGYIAANSEVVLKGDVDNDGDVDNVDAARLLRYVLNAMKDGETIDMEEAKVTDGDADIDMDDVVALKGIIASTAK